MEVKGVFEHFNMRGIKGPQVEFYAPNIKFLSFKAVAAHKYVISFCVGLELYNVGTRKTVFAAYTLTYALMSVLGIAIGIGVTSAIEHNENNYKATVGVLQVSYL